MMRNKIIFRTILDQLSWTCIIYDIFLHIDITFLLTIFLTAIFIQYEAFLVLPVVLDQQEQFQQPLHLGQRVFGASSQNHGAPELHGAAVKHHEAVRQRAGTELVHVEGGASAEFWRSQHRVDRRNDLGLCQAGKALQHAILR